MDVVPPPPIGSVELLGNAGTAVNVRLVGLAPATFLAGFWLARRLRPRGCAPGGRRSTAGSVGAARTPARW